MKAKGADAPARRLRGNLTERIASLSLDEFRRHLPYALRGLNYRWLGDRVVEVEAAGGTVTITVEDLPPLELSGVLSLPRLRVGFAFSSDDPAARAAFLATYDRAFQRGGG